MDHAWTVLCLRSIVDRETNQITLVDALENFELRGSAEEEMRAMAYSNLNDLAIQIETQLASLWFRTNPVVPEKNAYRVTLLAPDGKPCPAISRISHTVNLTETTKLRTFLKLTGLPFRGPGRYTFQIEVNTAIGQWNEVARVPYELSVDRVTALLENLLVQDESAAKKPRRKK